MTVNDASVARRVLTGRDIALAETYMDGLWDTPDLGALLDFGLANLSAGWGAGIPFVQRPVQRLRHVMRDNDPRGGSKRNVAHH
jgi:cyclopropane-fatty-acyl-phospholipid synthase